MADIIVDVSLSSPITTDVTSPTQALATNVSVPGPQGPAGPKGNPTTINSLGAENIIITGVDGNIVYTTGLNTIYISGNSGYFQSVVNSLTTNLNSTGANLNTSINNLSGLFTGYTGSLDATYATDSQLENTGSTLNTKIDNLSGYATGTNSTFATNLVSTGSTLDTKINTLSGYVTGTNSTFATNLVSTGSTLDTKINTLSGYVTGALDITLNSKINSLSGVSVLTYGDQIVVGTKYFNEDVYIHNLYVTGDEFIANVTNNFVESPYLLLNLTGGAIDGGIFFVTGSGFTGINDYGPIIGFDHSNKFKIGVARRSDDLSFLPDIASVQQIETYSGFVDNKYSTKINLGSTGSTLDTKINTLSGYVTGTNSTFTTNLFSTGSTLDTKINTLSGYVTGTNSTFTTNLFSTGSTLNTKINNLSGYINSSSSNIVFTTGDQTISGVKTFIGNHNISGDTIISGNLNVSGMIITPQQNKRFVYRPIVTGGGNATSMIAYGANCTLTPRYVGTLRADACISMWGVNGASSDTAQAASFWYGTGTAPVYSGNLVNLGGVRIGGLKHLQGTSSTAISTVLPVGTSWVAEITGLNTGTQYWFDIGISGSNGRLRVQDVQLYIEEKY